MAGGEAMKAGVEHRSCARKSVAGLVSTFSRTRLLIGITWGLRIILAGLFVYAGAIKVMDPAGLLADIQGYRLVPYGVAWAMAYYLPFLEIIAGAGLLIPRLSQSSAWILTGLMLVFTVALLSAWGRGLDITCGCFGQAMASSNYPWLVFRDLMILAGLAAILSRLKLQQGPVPVGLNDSPEIQTTSIHKSV